MLIILCKQADGAEGAEQIELSNEAPAESTPTNVPGQVVSLTETTNEALTAKKGTDDKKSAAPREPRERKQRGPPEDGVPSKTKVMVANLPYDLKEDRVRFLLPCTVHICLTLSSSSRSSRTTPQPRPRLLSAPFPVSWSRSSKLAVSLARAVASVSSPLALRSSSRRLAPR